MTKKLQLFLWLVSLHSLIVGIGLIVAPGEFLEFLGYHKCQEHFFRSQGGVFHIGMAIGYAMAAYDPKKFECLVIFSVIIKTVATVFLSLYALLAAPIAIIILSAVSDFILGTVVFVLYYFSVLSAKEEIK